MQSVELNFWATTAHNCLWHGEYGYKPPMAWDGHGVGNLSRCFTHNGWALSNDARRLDRVLYWKCCHGNSALENIQLCFPHFQFDSDQDKFITYSLFFYHFTTASLPIHIVMLHDVSPLPCTYHNCFKFHSHFHGVIMVTVTMSLSILDPWLCYFWMHVIKHAVMISNVQTCILKSLWRSRP